MANRLIGDYYCPCCGINLYGNYTGDELVDQFGLRTFIRFYFTCPNKLRQICMLESPMFMDKVFWIKEQENMMDKYLVKKTVTSPNTNLLIIYLYFPDYIEGDKLLDLLENQIKMLKSKGYVIGFTYPKSFESKVKKFSNESVIEWMLDDKMYEFCRHTVYGSLLAEQNVINESRKWLKCKLCSIYPTIKKDFECLNEIDLNLVEKMLI